MTQFQPQVPDPLSNDLPALLTPGGMAAPTIGVLLSIFVREGNFKAAPMQRECHDISGREGSLRQHRQEQFGDDPIALDAHAGLCRPCWMSRYHDATALSIGTHAHLRAVIERPYKSTFRTAELLIWRKGEPKLDLSS